MSAPSQLASTAPSPPLPQPGAGRVAAIDVLRGFVMFLMLAEVMHLAGLAKADPSNLIYEFLAFHTSHVEWRGCSLHDLIQPAFSLLVGAALPFSLAARRSRGQSRGEMLRHAALRAFVLIALGIFLRSIGKQQTYFTFEDTLTQIGLGYLPLFLLALASVRVQVAALVLILVGYWAAFAAYPVPADFDYVAVGVPANWPEHFNGFLAHWNKNSNLAWAFDTWFLNLFPRESPFLFNRGGYATLSFLPTLGTMLMGLLAGGRIKRGGRAGDIIRWFMSRGGIAIGIAIFLDLAGVCPIVKRIWTPTFTLLSGGLVYWMLAALYWITEVKGRTRWAFPLMVIGANSIAAYVMSGTMEGFFLAAIDRHLGSALFASLGAYGPVLRGMLVLAIFWTILLWMYRRNVFVRI
jgi:heparan-alpha-glucosaminide N-acetyltransferase